MIEKHAIPADSKPESILVPFEFLDIKPLIFWKIFQFTNMIDDCLTILRRYLLDLLTCPVVPDYFIHKIITFYNVLSTAI